MSSYLLVFTVSNDCKCLGCRGTPWRGPGEPAQCWASDTRECLISVLPWPQPCKGSGERSSESAFGIPESINKTCGSQGPSLMFSWLLCPIFISGMEGFPAVLRVTVGGSVVSRFPSLCLLFFRLASCVTDKKFAVCLLFPGLISMEGCMLMKLVDYIHGTIQV